MRTIKILLVISTVIFSSDLGFLHQEPFIQMIAAGSTIFFGITTYLMYQQMGNYPRLRWFTLSTGLIFVAIAIITIIYLTTGNQLVYDMYSVFLLLPVYLNTILAFVLLRGK